MNEPKMGPTEMRAEIIRLHHENLMPTLERLLEVIVETRAEYREKILAARRGKKKALGPNLTLDLVRIRRGR